MIAMGRSRRLAGLLMTMAIAAAATGCVAQSASPAPAALEGSASSAPTPSAAPTPAAPTPVPTVGTAPSGDWKALSWIRVQGNIAAGYPPIVPSVSEVDDGLTYDLEGPNTQLEWTYQGYLQLLWDPYQRVWTPWLSADAQAWQRGRPIDLGAWKAGFAEWDKLATSQLARDGCGPVVDDYAVSPRAIVLRAHFECRWSCGGGYLSETAMWSSPDGLNWTAIDSAKQFGKSDVDRIYGGGAGLIGLAPGRKSSWTSGDGQAWHKGTVPAEAFEISDPVSIAGGFVIGGTIRMENGRPIKPGDRCLGGDPTAGGQFQAVAWVSSDGVHWQSNVITPTLYANATVDIERLDDHTIIATVRSVVPDQDWYAAGETSTSWLSRDGRSWARLTLPGEAGWLPIPLQGGNRGLVSNGGHYAIGTNGTMYRLVEEAAPVSASFGAIGDMPPGDGRAAEAIGPVGVLATDGKTFWLGIPS